MAILEIDLPEYLNFHITDAGPLSLEISKRGFYSFHDLAEHIRGIPYGRTKDRQNLLSVLDENRGTCSLKHQLLASVAHECGYHEVKLVVGVYEMSEKNTPGVGPVLEKASIDSIPEAHCYLNINGCRFDFTGLNNGESSPFDSLLSEYEVLPEDLAKNKPEIHKEAIKIWTENQNLNFAQAWALREECINKLTANK